MVAVAVAVVAVAAGGVASRWLYLDSIVVCIFRVNSIFAPFRVHVYSYSVWGLGVGFIVSALA